jgi:hypothetical protein
MTTHIVAYGDLDVTLRDLVRTGHRIDAVLYRSESDEFRIITEDRIETRGGAK